MAIRIDVERDLVVAVADACAQWTEFKRGHDINSLMMKCCDVSAKFFDSLEHLTEVTIRDAAHLDDELDRTGRKRTDG
jgi:hypothetical protein